MKKTILIWNIAFIFLISIACAQEIDWGDPELNAGDIPKESYGDIPASYIAANIDSFESFEGMNREELQKAMQQVLGVGEFTIEQDRSIAGMRFVQGVLTYGKSTFKHDPSARVEGIIVKEDRLKIIKERQEIEVEDGSMSFDEDGNLIIENPGGDITFNGEKVSVRPENKGMIMFSGEKLISEEGGSIKIGDKEFQNGFEIRIENGKIISAALKGTNSIYNDGQNKVMTRSGETDLKFDGSEKISNINVVAGEAIYDNKFQQAVTGRFSIDIENDQINSVLLMGQKSAFIDRVEDIKITPSSISIPPGESVNIVLNKIPLEKEMEGDFSNNPTVFLAKTESGKTIANAKGKGIHVKVGNFAEDTLWHNSRARIISSPEFTLVDVSYDGSAGDLKREINSLTAAQKAQFENLRRNVLGGNADRLEKLRGFFDDNRDALEELRKNPDEYKKLLNNFIIQAGMEGAFREGEIEQLSSAHLDRKIQELNNIIPFAVSTKKVGVTDKLGNTRDFDLPAAHSMDVGNGKTITSLMDSKSVLEFRKLMVSRDFLEGTQNIAVFGTDVRINDGTGSLDISREGFAYSIGEETFSLGMPVLKNLKDYQNEINYLAKGGVSSDEAEAYNEAIKNRARSRAMIASQYAEEGNLEKAVKYYSDILTGDGAADPELKELAASQVINFEVMRHNDPQKAAKNLQELGVRALDGSIRMQMLVTALSVDVSAMQESLEKYSQLKQELQEIEMALKSRSPGSPEYRDAFGRRMMLNLDIENMQNTLKDQFDGSTLNNVMSSPLEYKGKHIAELSEAERRAFENSAEYKTNQERMFILAGSDSSLRFGADVLYLTLATEIGIETRSYDLMASANGALGFINDQLRKDNLAPADKVSLENYKKHIEGNNLHVEAGLEAPAWYLDPIDLAFIAVSLPSTVKAVYNLGKAGVRYATAKAVVKQSIKAFDDYGDDLVRVLARTNLDDEAMKQGLKASVRGLTDKQISVLVNNRNVVLSYAQQKGMSSAGRVLAQYSDDLTRQVLTIC